MLQAAIPALRRLWAPKPIEPSYPALPEVDEATGETNVPGIYAAGDLLDVVIVGAGSAGFAATLNATQGDGFEED